MNTSVLIILPYVAAADLNDSDHHPGMLADASVASLLTQTLGSSDQWTWSDRENQVTLADLMLEPIDTVVISEDLLEKVVRFKLAANPDQQLEGSGKDNHRLARELVRTLGSHPALYSDIDSAPPAGSPGPTTLDLEIGEELLERYNKLRASAEQLQADLQPEAEAADFHLRRMALIESLRWGISPMKTEEQDTLILRALFDSVEPEDPSLLKTLAMSTFDILQGRLEAADPAKLLKPQDIVRAIAELAAPEGQLAVFSRMDANTLLSRTKIATTTPDLTLDTDWLCIVSAVRPYMARLEALQLEATVLERFTAFTSWSNNPGDHWCEQIFRDNQNKQINVPRFVAAYTPGNQFPADDAHPHVAAALLDSWGEVIPMQRHVTTVAFGFNAPAARAQQAILQAVPPELYHTLDTETLVRILEETRQLAYARAARPQDLGIYQGVQPSMMFDANVPDGVYLGPRSRFDD